MIKILRFVIFALIGFEVFFSVGAFGARPEVPLSAVQGVAFLILFFSIILFMEQKIEFGFDFTSDKEIFPFFVIFIAYSLYISFQFIPFPVELLRYISPKGFEIFKNISLNSLNLPVHFNETAHLSIFHSATLLELIKNFAYASIVFGVYVYVKERYQLYMVAILIIVLGFLESGYGMYQYFSGSYKVWSIQYSSGEGITGTYFNRNHFAGLFELILPFTVAFGFYFIKHFKKIGINYKDILARGKEQFFIVLTGVSFIFMAVGIIFSTSRMGIFSFLCGIFYFVYMNTFDSYKNERKFIFNFLGLFILLLVLFVSYIGLDPVTERFTAGLTEGKLTDSFRIKLWENTISIIKDFWLTGTGLGTYSYIMPQYKDIIFKNHFVDHAHQDILQFVSETGLIGFCFLIVFLVLFYKKTFCYFFQVKTNLRFILLGINTGITSIIIHSFTDYNTKVPGNCVVMAVLFGLWFSIIRIIETESALVTAEKDDI